MALSNFKTRFSGTFLALKLGKYANHHLGAFNYRFNRRFNLATMTERVVHAIYACGARPECFLKSAKIAT